MRNGICKVFGFDFETSEDAREFIEELRRYAATYGEVTLGDACELYGFTQFPQENYDIKLNNINSLVPIRNYQIVIPYNFKSFDTE